MAKSFNAIVSQILADTSSNQNLRIDLNRQRVYDALLQVLPAMIRQWVDGGRQLNMVPFCTVLPRLDIEVADFTQGGLLGEHVHHVSGEVDRAWGLPVGLNRQYVRLPQLMTWGGATGAGKPGIDYLGPLDGSMPLDIYIGNDYRTAPNRRFTGRQPFAWVQDSVAWLFSPTPIIWKELMGRVVLADPRDMAQFRRVYDEDETPMPWPDDVSDDLVKQLTNRYISMYGRHGAPAPSDGNQKSI